MFLDSEMSSTYNNYYFVIFLLMLPDNNSIYGMW